MKLMKGGRELHEGAPPQKFFEDLASLAKFDKCNAYAH